MPLIMLPNADFSISQQKLGVLRGCLEECGSTPHTIGSGRYFESHWKDGWNKVVEILEQVAARDQFLGYAEETRILLRCLRLLLTALDEDPHPRSEETRTIRVGIPAFGDDWPKYHKQVGSYHYGEVQQTLADLQKLQKAWLTQQPQETLPEASWLHICIEESTKFLDALAPRVVVVTYPSMEPRTSA
jgi:hypothetical protein